MLIDAVDDHKHYPTIHINDTLVIIFINIIRQHTITTIISDIHKHYSIIYNKHDAN